MDSLAVFKKINVLVVTKRYRRSKEGLLTKGTHTSRGKGSIL